MTKSPDAFRTISEVADWLGVQAHVLRFWESKFAQVKPVKRAGGRRYYRPADMQLLGGIKKLLHDDGLTIKGVQKMLREQGVAQVSSLCPSIESDLEPSAEQGAIEGTVVPFISRADEDLDTPDTSVAEPEISVEPDGVKPAPPATTSRAQASQTGAPDGADAPDAGLETPSDAAPEPDAAPDETAPPVSPRLPSFLHRDRAPSPEGDAQKPAPPRALVVDAPDPPGESEITVLPGVLAHLGQRPDIDPETAKQIAPLAGELRAWLDRVGGAGAN